MLQSYQRDTAMGHAHVRKSRPC
ncbi:hypothetical protein F383_34431 [Gossypium arboreum]|uniref:Uncharacterized protein n=1 Tax=Gossypium arboreum TaxID=29729 RepID=A0A0B0N9A6_GOSAR|nr:hypothetical protein F383_34431 [Gossypium arboreum]